MLNLNGSGTITNSNATAAVLTDQTTNSQAFSGNLTGNLGLVETGNGTLTLAGANSYSSNTTLSGATLMVGSNSALGGNASTTVYVGNTATLLTGGPFTVAQNVSVTASTGTVGAGTTDAATFTGSITLTGNTTFSTVPGGSVTFSGNIAGAGALQVNPGGNSSTPGLITFSGANNTYTGNVTVGLFNVASGNLTITNSTGLGIGPKTVTATANTGGGALNNSIHLSPLTGNITLPSNISFTLSGIAPPVLSSDAGNNTILGKITITAGAGATGVFVNGGSSLTLAGNISDATTNRTLILSGPGTGIITGLISNGVAALPLDMRGTGTWTLANTNTYTGGTTIESGTLLAGGRQCPGEHHHEQSDPRQRQRHQRHPRPERLQRVGRDPALAGNGTDQELITDSGANATLTINQAVNATFGSNLTLSGSNLSFSKAGAANVTLTGNNTYGGGTTVSNGTLQLGSATAVPTEQRHHHYHAGPLRPRRLQPDPVRPGRQRQRHR